MKKHFKEFLLRGLIFAGFGPIVAAIVFFILQLSLSDGVALDGIQVFITILSTYVIAFIHAGSSVFHQVETWSPLKSAFLQLLALYLVYLVAYLLNSWLPFEPLVVVIFSVLFIVGYFVIWLTVFLLAKKETQNLNQKI